MLFCMLFTKQKQGVSFMSAAQVCLFCKLYQLSLAVMP